MKFHNRFALLAFTAIFVLFLVLVRYGVGAPIGVVLLFMALYITFAVGTLGYYFVITDDFFVKYVWFREVARVRIRDIRSIEAIQQKKYGTVYIQIGRAPKSIYFYWIRLADRTTIKASASCRNKEKLTLGRYLKSHCRIKFIERETYKFGYDKAERLEAEWLCCC